MGGFLSGRTSLTTVQTADIAADAITLAKIAAGTDGNIISYDASGDPVAIATGSDGQVLTSTGAGSPPAFEAVSASFTLGTEQATTSGTSVTFGSIPAGTKMIVILFMGLGSSTNVDVSIQIGDSGGIESASYLGSDSNASGATVATSNEGTGDWSINKFAAANLLHGHAILTLADTSNTWVQSHTVVNSAAGTSFWGGGSKALSGELTQVLVGVPSGALNAGSVNIMYM